MVSEHKSSSCLNEQQRISQDKKPKYPAKQQHDWKTFVGVYNALINSVIAPINRSN